MAKLKDIVSLIDKSKNNHNSHESVHVAGKKRRAWLQEEVIHSNKSNGVYRPHLEMGSINGVDQPHLKDSQMGSINGVDQPHLSNGVYRPHLKSSKSNGVDQPHLEKQNFGGLHGNPLAIIYLFLKKSQKMMTEEVRNSEIAYQLNISRDSVRTAVRFLLKNNFIERVELKIGKNGWSKYSITKAIYDDVSKAILMGLINPIKISPGQMGSNSSSSLNINTTTNTSQALGGKWSDLDFSDLSEIGFSKNHLKQLADKKNLTAESVQGSIHHFAYGLRHTDKVKQYDNPLNVLMGVLCKGQAWIEPSYKSKQELAQELLLNQKLKSQARLKKMREQAYDVALDDWIDGLSKPQLEAIAPEKKARGDFMPQKIKLGLHFREQVWPTVQQEYLVPD